MLMCITNYLSSIIVYLFIQKYTPVNCLTRSEKKMKVVLDVYSFDHTGTEQIFSCPREIGKIANERTRYSWPELIHLLISQSVSLLIIASFGKDTGHQHGVS